MGMNVLINGAEVIDVRRGNRGAEQLLRSTSRRLTSMGFQPAVTVRQVDPALRAEIGLKEYVGNPRLQALDRIVPPIDMRGFATLRSFRGVLDASGYALGDPWGPHTAQWLMRKYAQWSALGLKIVALPQAFGPFEDPAVRSAAKAALERCDLIVAREEESYGHLQHLGIDPIKCRICPDITIAEGPREPASDRKKRLVVVPNWNLAKRTNREKYLDCLTGVVEWGNTHGYEVVGLLHEGRGDLEILEALAGVAQIRVVRDLSGWETKNFIAESSLVAAGRYHAVVAALSTGTPVVTHSWSHKYLELLRQFGVEDWICDPGDREATLRALTAVAGVDTSALKDRKKKLVSEIEDMWVEVGSVLTK
ncbi:polysaccharide pyruvyl transferase family protein [Rhodococcus pyridinivorans]|uniref:polysaccharide pyruvyl transferase family protein n=1 Tax=Rhodococcus pyridinivorans TaxID=103816 RepID=UPI000BA1C7AC|nr:polysaccharide pyruvyl transferase family protein [Rhodococcus pyridinivorans]